MYSNEYIDISEIDTDRLENDLYDYYGTGAFAVSPAMFDKAERVRRMSDEELVKTAFILRLCLLFMLLWRTGSGRGFSISDVLIPDSQQDLIIKGAKTN